MQRKNDKNDRLVWLFDKENMHKTSIQHMQQWKYLSSYAWWWLPIFICLCSGIYYLTIVTLPIYGKQLTYTYAEKVHLIVGVIAGCFILSIYAIFDTLIPSILIDKKTHDMIYRPFCTTCDNRGDDDHVKMVIMSNNKFMVTPDEKQNMAYSIPFKHFELLKQQGKLDSITVAQWIKELDKSSHIWKGVSGRESQTDKFLDISFTEMSTSSTRRVALLLTIAFIISQWNIKVYDKLSYWIYGGIIIEAIISSINISFNSSYTPYVWLYIKKRVQVMTALLGIIVLFLFRAVSSKNKLSW
jgi:hypothetical protein